MRAGVSPENVDRAVASIDEEVGRLVRDGLTQAELDDSRRFLIHAMPRALETNSSIANFLQNAELYGLGPRLRRAPAGPAARRHARRGECGRPPFPRSRKGDRRDRRTLRSEVVQAVRPATVRYWFVPDPPARAVLFDVDFTLIYPGPMFQGEGYHAFCARHLHRRRSGALRRRRGQRVVDSRRPRRIGVRRRNLRRLHAAHHRADGRQGGRTTRSSRRLRARDLRGVGGEPALRAVRRCAGGAARAERRGHPNRPDFEFAPLSRLLPVAFRAARVHRRGGVVGRSRLHEAAPEHLSGGARQTCGLRRPKR